MSFDLFGFVNSSSHQRVAILNFDLIIEPNSPTAMERKFEIHFYLWYLMIYLPSLFSLHLMHFAIINKLTIPTQPTVFLFFTISLVFFSIQPFSSIENVQRNGSKCMFSFLAYDLSVWNYCELLHTTGWIKLLNSRISASCHLSRRICTVAGKVFCILNLVKRGFDSLGFFVEEKITRCHYNVVAISCPD